MPGGTPPPAAAPSFLGVRDALKGYGLDLGKQFTDDHSALQHLALAYQRLQQSQGLLPYAEQYQRHAGEFQEYLRARAEAQRQQQQGQKPSWWQAPEYDPNWVNKLTRDPVTGELRVLPGNDPSILQKFSQALDHRTSFLDKFAFDPIGSIKPGLEETVREIAQQMIQEQMGSFQDRNFANSWVQQNAAWLHARDQQGNVLRDPGTGAPQLSQVGQRFATYVQALDGAGLKNVQLQQALAQRLVEGDLARLGLSQQTQGQAAAQTGEQQKQDFLTQAAQTGAQPAPANYGAAAAQEQPPLKTPQDLMKAMMASFTTAGFKPGDSLF